MQVYGSLESSQTALPRQAMQAVRRRHVGGESCALPNPSKFCEVPDVSHVNFNDYVQAFRLTEETRVARRNKPSWIETLLKHPEVVTDARDRTLVDQVIAPYLLNYVKLNSDDVSKKTIRFLRKCRPYPQLKRCNVENQCKRVASDENRPFSLRIAQDEMSSTINFEALNLLIVKRDKNLGPNLREEGYKQILLKKLDEDLGVRVFYELPVAIGDWRSGDYSLRTPDFIVPELRYDGKLVVFDPHEFYDKPNRTIKRDVARWQKLHSSTQENLYLILSSSERPRDLERRIGCRLETVADEYWMVPNGKSRLGEIRDKVSGNLENLLGRDECFIWGDIPGYHTVPQEFLEQVAAGMYLIKNTKRI